MSVRLVRAVGEVMLAAGLVMGAPFEGFDAMAQSQVNSFPDSQIESNVLRALATDPQLAKQNIRSVTVYGTVTLTGSVQTEQMRISAENLAARAMGVRKVVDELAVNNSSSSAVTSQTPPLPFSNGVTQTVQPYPGQSYPAQSQTYPGQAQAYARQPQRYPAQGYSAQPQASAGQIQAAPGQVGGYPAQGGYPATAPSGGAAPAQAMQQGMSTNYARVQAEPATGQTGVVPGQTQPNTPQAYPGQSYPAQAQTYSGQTAAYPAQGYPQAANSAQVQQAASPNYAPGSSAPGNSGLYGASGQMAGVPVTVAGGSVLRIRLNRTLDPDHVSIGEIFDGTVITDIVSGDAVAIPRGAEVNGVVVGAHQSGILQDEPALSLRITSVTLGGQVYPLTTDVWPPTEVGQTPGDESGIISPKFVLNFRLSTPATVKTVSEEEMERLSDQGAEPQPPAQTQTPPPPPQRGPADGPPGYSHPMGASYGSPQ
ncbi:MAG: BON domain-containing protein [Acidobacteriaceae bacterium]